MQPIVRCRVRVTLQPHHNATTSQPHRDHIATMVTLQRQLQADAFAKLCFINMVYPAKPACRKSPQRLRIGVAGEVIIINVDRTDGDAYRVSFRLTFPMSCASLIWAGRLVKPAFKRSRQSRLPRGGKTGSAEFRHGQLVSNNWICPGYEIELIRNIRCVYSWVWRWNHEHLHFTQHQSCNECCRRGHESWLNCGHICDTQIFCSVSICAYHQWRLQYSCWFWYNCYSQLFWHHWQFTFHTTPEFNFPCFSSPSRVESCMSRVESSPSPNVWDSSPSPSPTRSGLESDSSPSPRTRVPISAQHINFACYLRWWSHPWSFTRKSYILSHTPFSSWILLQSDHKNFQILPTHPPFYPMNNHPIPPLYNTINWCCQFQSWHYFSFPPHKLCFQRIWPRKTTFLNPWIHSRHACLNQIPNCCPTTPHIPWINPGIHEAKRERNRQCWRRWKSPFDRKKFRVYCNLVGSLISKAKSSLWSTISVSIKLLLAQWSKKKPLNIVVRIFKKILGRGSPSPLPRPPAPPQALGAWPPPAKSRASPSIRGLIT